MRRVQKADSIDIVQCACGRVQIVLLDAKGRIFASAELDPDQWFSFADGLVNENRKIVEGNQELRVH